VSQFAVSVVLARLLTPADFGVVALALVVLGLARPIGDLGIGNAIVQRKDLTDRHVRVAFTCSVLLGVTVRGRRRARGAVGRICDARSSVTSVVRVLSWQFALGGGAVVAERCCGAGSISGGPVLSIHRVHQLSPGLLPVWRSVWRCSGSGSGAWCGAASCNTGGVGGASRGRPACVRPLLARGELAELPDI